MKGLFEASKNFAETMRASGDAMLLPMLCLVVITITAFALYSCIRASIRASMARRKQQRDNTRSKGLS